MKKLLAVALVLTSFSGFSYTSPEVRIPAKLNSHSGQREHPDP